MSLLRIFVLTFVTALGLVAQTTPAPVVAPEDAALVEQLGNPEFSVREAATAKLKARGELARTALMAGTKSANLETSTRCGMLLKDLAGEPVSEAPLKEVRPQQPGAQSKITAFHSMSLRNGERVDVSRQSDGSIKLQIAKLNDRGQPAGEVQTAEAASVEEFQRIYPELYKSHVEKTLAGQTRVPLEGLEGWPFRDAGRARGLEAVLAPNAGPRLDVHLEAASTDLCEHLDLPLGSLRITAVVPEGAGAKAGLRVNDLLLKVDGAQVLNAADIRRALQACVSDNAVLTIVRKGVVQQMSLPRPH